MRGPAALTSLPGLTSEAKGRVPVPVGCPGDAGTQTGPAPVRGEAPSQSPLGSADSQAARGRARPPGLRRARSCGTMSQRQVLQGRGCGGRPRTGGGSQGTTARPAPPCLSPQCSSSTRKPEPSSCRWWQSWRPDPKTSRPCRMRVSPRLTRVHLFPPGCVTWGPGLALRLESLVALGPQPCFAPHCVPCQSPPCVPRTLQAPGPGSPPQVSLYLALLSHPHPCRGR